MLTSQTSEKTIVVEQWEVYVKPASGKRVWKPLKKKIHKVHKLATVNYLEKGAANYIKIKPLAHQLNPLLLAASRNKRNRLASREAKETKT